jgi:hypothetical protein
VIGETDTAEIEKVHALCFFCSLVSVRPGATSESNAGRKMLKTESLEAGVKDSLRVRIETG